MIPQRIRKVVGGDLEQYSVGIGEVDRVRNLVISKSKRDGSSLEFSLRGSEVFVRRSSKCEVPDPAIRCRLLTVLLREEVDEGGTQAQEDRGARSVVWKDVLETESVHIPCLRRFG